MKLRVIHIIAVSGFFCFVSHCFQESREAKLVLNAKDTRELPYFNGKENRFQTQEIRVLEDKVLIGTNDAVFVISSNSFAQATGRIAFDQVLHWDSSNATKCIASENNCHNSINIIGAISSNLVLVCGMSATPDSTTCRQYQWQEGGLLKEKPTLTQSWHQKNVSNKEYGSFSFAYKLSLNSNKGKNAYFAFGSDSNQFTPSIGRRSVFQKRQKDNVPLSFNSHGARTILNVDTQARPPWLHNPYFVGMFETPEKIFIFFREVAVEAAFEQEMPVFSRVAQICKNDKGGNEQWLKGKWTSFFKARLNCSIPGKQPFYFNEIQHVEGPIMFKGKMTLFATFTTPKDAITGSAICAFTMYEIASAMAGNFKEQDKTTGYWKNRIPDFPRPHPSNCKRNIPKNDKMLKFIREHSFLSESVQAVGFRPLFTSTKERFSSFGLENNVPYRNGSLFVFYIGTHDGKLLKYVIDAEFSNIRRTTVLSEEWQLYRPDICSKQRLNVDPIKSFSANNSNANDMQVKSVTLLPLSNFVVVSFSKCMISVPKKSCYYYKCESACVGSGNPYCGWISGICIPITANNRRFHQNIFAKATEATSCHPKDNAEVNDILAGRESKDDSCTYKDTIIYGLAGGLTVAFTLIIFLVICLCTKCNKNNSSVVKYVAKQPQKEQLQQKNHNTIVSQEISSQNSRPNRLDSCHFSTSNEQAISRSSMKVQIRSQPQHKRNAGNPTLLNHAGENQPANLKNIQAVLDMSRQDSFSYDSSSWSEDISVNENSLLNQSTEMVLKQLPHEGGREPIKPLPYQCGKAVGVAHPFKQASVKISQVVKPTVIAQPFSRRHYSSDTNTYVEVEDDQATTHTALVNLDEKFSNQARLVAKPTTTSNVIAIVENQKRQNSQVHHEMTSFSPPTNPQENVEVRFPPPPLCLTTTKDKPQMESYPSSSLATTFHSTSFTPIQAILPNNSSFAKGNDKVYHTESFLAKTLSGKEGKNIFNHQQQNAVVQSVSNESASSGFLSSSPQTSFISQPTLNETITPADFQQYKTDQTVKGLAENVYDEVFEDIPSLMECDSCETISETTSLCQEELKLDYPNPEYCYESDELDGEIVQNDEYTKTVESFKTKHKTNKTKRSIFFRSKKNKKNKKTDPVHNDETFFSPSYDEEPVVPVVKGWKEIEYDAVSSLSGNDESSRAINDSRLFTTEHKRRKEKEHGFFTMRPKNHRRQKLPKLRNTDKQWTTGNNPRPVPTPAVPKVEHI